jgi:hypothetical protein
MQKLTKIKRIASWALRLRQETRPPSHRWVQMGLVRVIPAAIKGQTWWIRVIGRSETILVEVLENVMELRNDCAMSRPSVLLERDHNHSRMPSPANFSFWANHRNLDWLGNYVWVQASQGERIAADPPKLWRSSQLVIHFWGMVYHWNEFTTQTLPLHRTTQSSLPRNAQRLGIAMIGCHHFSRTPHFQLCFERTPSASLCNPSQVQVLRRCLATVMHRMPRRQSHHRLPGSCRRVNLCTLWESMGGEGQSKPTGAGSTGIGGGGQSIRGKHKHLKFEKFMRHHGNT